MIRSTWTAETHVRAGWRFVCVTDLDFEGTRSVTNDIENVIDNLKRTGLLHAGDRLVYRDSMGVWDEALLDAHCRFVDYRSLNARSFDKAITVALEKA